MAVEGDGRRGEGRWGGHPFLMMSFGTTVAKQNQICRRHPAVDPAETGHGCERLLADRWPRNESMFWSAASHISASFLLKYIKRQRRHRPSERQTPRRRILVCFALCGDDRRNPFARASRCLLFFLFFFARHAIGGVPTE